jgi:hypothetical protein
MIAVRICVLTGFIELPDASLPPLHRWCRTNACLGLRKHRHGGIGLMAGIYRDLWRARHAGARVDSRQSADATRHLGPRAGFPATPVPYCERASHPWRGAGPQNRHRPSSMPPGGLRSRARLPRERPRQLRQPLPGILAPWFGDSRQSSHCPRANQVAVPHRHARRMANPSPGRTFCRPPRTTDAALPVGAASQGAGVCSLPDPRQCAICAAAAGPVCATDRLACVGSIGSSSVGRPIRGASVLLVVLDRRPFDDVILGS